MKIIKASYLNMHRQTSYAIPVYQIVSEEGPHHDKTFTAEVLVGEKVLGEGKGKSKKEAEQNAAQVALNTI